MYDLVICNAAIAHPDGTTHTGDIACQNGRIAKIDNLISAPSREHIDAAGQLLIPGVIDPQVHFREPGATDKEDLESGSRAAVRGGVTSFLEMPNCNPPTTDQQQLDWKLARAAATSTANFGFFIGATNDNLEALNSVNPACGIKIFMGSSTGNLLVDEQEALDRIFGDGQRLIAVHAEDETRIQARTRAMLAQEETTDYGLHSQIRDPQTALIATERALALSEKYGRRLHILHLSTSEEVARLRRHKPEQVTCEVIPNHLFLDTDDYGKLGSRAQMNPPIRSPDNATDLWRGLHQGVIDIIATDHAPHTLEEKTQPYPKSPSGMPGVETSLPLMLTAMQAGQCTLAEVQQWMCSGPARVYGIKNKGHLAEDFDADLTLVDIKTTRPVRDEEVFSRAGWSPYAGRELTGWPSYTIVGGQVVFDNGRIRPGVFGKALEFQAP
jgi:dihydroorotase